jgi:hypothetical protein
MMKIMENKESSLRKILLDGDVISHFIKGELFDLLPRLYPDRLIILDIVKTEIYQRKGWDSIIEDLIKKHGIEEIKFPEGIDFKKEYSFLISASGHALGKGESACMVFCRFNQEILASSNLKDIHRYCSLHKIDYLTTADILFEGFSKNLVSEIDCDTFITKVKSKGSKFRFGTMKELIAAMKPSK